MGACDAPSGHSMVPVHAGVILAGIGWSLVVLLLVVAHAEPNDALLLVLPAHRLADRVLCEGRRPLPATVLNRQSPGQPDPRDGDRAAWEDVPRRLRSRDDVGNADPQHRPHPDELTLDLDAGP